MKALGLVIALSCCLALARPSMAAPSQGPAKSVEGWSWAKQVPATEGAVGVDEGTSAPEESASEPLDWTASLRWSHTASSQIFGIGQDFLSTNHFRYVQALELSAAYFLVRSEAYMLTLSAAFGAQTEITESAEVVQGRVNPADTALGVTINAPLARTKGVPTTWFTGSLIGLFPTSRQSFGSGRLLLLSPRVGLLQRLPLAGKGVFLIDDFAAQISLRYDHQFSLATNPVSPFFRRTRQDVFGDDLSDNTLSGGQIPSGTVRGALNLQFDDAIADVPVMLVLGTGYAVSLLPGVAETQVETLTGTAEPVTIRDPRSARQLWSVNAMLGAQLTNYLGLNLLYSSTVDPAELSPNPFNTPFSVFIANLSLSLDALFAPGQAFQPINQRR